MAGVPKTLRVLEALKMNFATGKFYVLTEITESAVTVLQYSSVYSSQY